MTKFATAMQQPALIAAIESAACENAISIGNMPVGVAPAVDHVEMRRVSERPEMIEFICAPRLRDMEIGIKAHAILQREPMIRYRKSGQRLLKYKPVKDLLREFKSGAITFPRLSGLHELLCGPGGADGRVATDNGANSIPHTALILTSMRTFVQVREPHLKATYAHLRSLIQFMDLDLHSRINYEYDMDREDGRFADIAYWAGPAPRIFQEIEDPQRMLEYMGRNVMEGGFMVFQSDLDGFDVVPEAGSRWRRIYSHLMDSSDRIDGVVIPSRWYRDPNRLSIYRRLSEECAAHNV